MNNEERIQNIFDRSEKIVTAAMTGAIGCMAILVGLGLVVLGVAFTMFLFSL